MKQQSKRVLALVLTLCLLMSMMPAMVIGAAAAEGTRTIYFDNSGKNWSTVFVYTWNENGECTGSWPGSPMNYVGGSIYSYEVPAEAVNIIFADDAGSQTADQVIPTNGNNLFSAAGTWKVYATDYRLVGYINGANYGCEEDSGNPGAYKFENGKLTAFFSQDSYVFLKTADNARWYLAESYCTDTTCTFKEGGTEKMFVPGGNTMTFTLTENADGTLTMSYKVDGGSCAHDYTASTTPPTCINDGKTVYTCTKCGDQYTNIEGATGHNFVSKITTAPTCTTGGVLTYTCTNCTEKYTEAMVANGHSYENGRCTACGKVDPNCNHNYTSEVTNAATCLRDGAMTYTCTKCGDVYSETIPATGHNYEDIIVPPTCENNGYTRHRCVNCGEYTFNTDAVNPIGHNYSSVVTAPTCTEKGYTTYTCANCGNTYTWNETEATGHSYMGGVCTGCGDVDATYVKEYYLFGFINNANYGCDNDYENMGEYKFVNGKLTVKFESASYVGVKITNNEAWYMTQAYTEDTIATLYNTNTGAGEKLYVPGNVEVTFTITEGADDTLILSYVAAECEHLYSSYVSQQPGCETTGIRVHTCGYCGHSYEETMAAWGHSYYGGVCTGCGAADPNYVSSDYYLFGYINGQDMGWKDDINNLGYYKFVDGQLTVRFDEASYVAVKTGDNKHFYMTNGYQGEVPSVELIEFADPYAVAANRMYIPGGAPVTLTLSTNSQGNLVLSYKLPPSACPHTVHSQEGICAACGTPVGHTYSYGVCTICNAVDSSYNPYTYYLFGYINGENYGSEDDAYSLGDYKFEDGKLTTTFEIDSYVAVKKVNPGAKFGPEVVGWYMTDGWAGEATSITLYNTANLTTPDKLFVPGGVEVTFTLTANDDDTLTLSYTTAGCSHSFSGGFCTNCGAEDPNYVPASDDYYLFGYINGVDYDSDIALGEYKFVDGKLTVAFTTNSYIAVKKVQNGQPVAWYMTDGWVGEVTSTTLYNTINLSKVDKLYIPGGMEVTLTLTVNANDTLTLSYTNNNEGECDHSFSGGFCTNCGAEDPNYVPASDDYYLFGYINGADYGNEELGSYKFENGKLTTTFEMDSYVAVKKVQNGQPVAWYMTDGWAGEVTSTTLYNTINLSNVDKLYIPGGMEVTLTLTVNANDTLTLSYTTNSNEGECDHSFSGGFCTNCGAEDPNYVPSTDDYYLFGYINGADYGNEELGSYKFVNGKLTTTFEMDSYIAVKKVQNGQAVAWYMTDGWAGEVTSTTLYNTNSLSSFDKLYIPGGVQVTLTLTVNANDTLTISYSEAGCDHSFVGGFCTNCGAEDPNYVPNADEYYLFGYINGEDYGNDTYLGNYKFVNGKLTVTFTENSYIAVKKVRNGETLGWYMTDGWIGESTSTTLYNTNDLDDTANKMFVPGGVEVTLHLTTNNRDTLNLYYTTTITDPMTAPTLTPKYPTVSFEDVILMNIYFDAVNTQDVVEMGLITFDREVDYASITLADDVIPGYIWNESVALNVASTNGIPAKEMGRKIYFAVYAKLRNGTYTYSNVNGYSVETYAKKQLGSGSAAMKALMVATLNYGAAAQKHFLYNTNKLVNASLTTAQKNLITGYSSSMVSTAEKPSASKLGAMQDNGGYAKRYATVSFEGAFSINYYFAPSANVVGNVTMYVWTQADYNAASSLNKNNASYAITMKLLDNGEYQGTIEGIAAKNLNDAVYVSFCYTDGYTSYCSGVNGYSIGQYCKSQAAKTGTMAELAKATAVYGYYAKQRFG